MHILRIDTVTDDRLPGDVHQARELLRGAQVGPQAVRVDASASAVRSPVVPTEPDTIRMANNCGPASTIGRVPDDHRDCEGHVANGRHFGFRVSRHALSFL